MDNSIIPADDLSSLASFFPAWLSPWIFIKILFLIGLTLYLAFAGMVVRQVNLMTRTLQGGYDRTLKLVSWAHLIVALGIFLLSLIIL
ncbi:DUF5657 family protein [Patescibacteria group bacterium]